MPSSFMCHQTQERWAELSDAVPCRGSPLAAARQTAQARRRSATARLHSALWAPYRRPSPLPWASCTRWRAWRASWEVCNLYKHLYVRLDVPLIS